MITITVLLFTILGALATGLFKFLIVIGGVALEILLAMIVFAAIGLYGLGILFIVDIIFLIFKVVGKHV